jgi:hypothetical protein
MVQDVAAAPESLIVRMGDDNGGPETRLSLWLLERDKCH